MIRFILILILIIPIIGYAQSVLPLRADTVRIEKIGGSAELHLRNATRDSLGVLTNIGNGRTRFLKSRRSGDTLFIGKDTIIIVPPAPTIQEVINNGNHITDANDSIIVDPGKIFGIYGDNSTVKLKSTGAASSTTLHSEPTTAYLEFRNLSNNAIQRIATNNSNGIQVIDNVDTVGLYYNGNYKVKGIALQGDRWIPDWGAVQEAVAGVTSGINQLTGDVTAGPGSGSQAATIANNAVTDAKLRQGAATSVIGRASNSTGNVADIVATIAGMYLKRGSSSVLWDSVDYADLKNRPDLQNPGVYFGPAESFDPTFVVFASAIPRTSNAFSQGNPITWEILDHTTDHNSSFFDSAYGGGSGQLIVRFPPVKNVLNTTFGPDETGAANLMASGPSTALGQFDGFVYRPIPVNIRLSGNGTTTWVENSSLGLSGYFDLSTFSTTDGGTSFNIVSGFNIDYEGLGINYIGNNSYRVKRTYSGLGIYNVRFNMVDEFNNPVTVNPSTDDVVSITSAAMGSKLLQMNTWTADNGFLDGFFNYWIFGAYECWMVAAPTSTTSVLVRWQNYPSATNYKIYRATSLYGARTLIHTGTDNSYTDSGLSAGTLYYYFMIATISGVDTEITHFTTNTKN